MTDGNSRTIFITGANGGMGEAIARRFLSSSANDQLWLGVRSNRTAADSLADEFCGRVHVVEHDVTSSKSWTNVIDQIVASDGRIDVLINNAGFHDDALLATMTEEQWRRVLAANLDGVFLGCRAVIGEMMKARFGRIINMASLSALLAPRGQTNYAAAKAGVVAMSQSLSKEVARAGITVNCVCPGYVDTGALAGMDVAKLKELKKSIPMRRFGTPDEVAAAIHFLACPDAAYITGSTIKIDGGIF